MTVQLFEGCWGVTQSLEKRGPIITVRPEQAVGEVGYIFFRVTGLRTYWTKSGVAAFASDSSDNIIAVFATEAEADAYLAGETDPVAAEIQRDMLAHSDFRAPAAPKPVTWPDGVSGRFSAESDWLTLISDAMAEANKAMVKFPQPNYVITKFAEEAGEVVKAAVHCAEGRETPQNLRGEIKQAIAMLYRLWNEGDQVHGLQPVAALLLAAADKVEGRG